MLQDGTNIIKVGNGLYATVDLDYSASTNTLELITSSGSKTIPLAGVTFIDRCYYDSVNKNIIIVYRDGQGNEHTTTIGASDLFNEWDVDNEQETSAIHLAKETASSGGTDKLSAYVILTDEIIDPVTHIPTGVMLPGTDNAIVKKGNSLYVSNSASTMVGCVSGKTDAIYKTLFGGIAPGGCGEGIQYIPDPLSCVISGATSFMEADKLMAYQICEILEMWVSGMTCTTTSNWVDDGANKKMLVDVRPSYGKTATMTDDDLYITDITGKTIEHGVNEFTDTNALRIVCLEDGGGVLPDIAAKQNGVYLSNAWNCGKYYQESTEAEEMAEVEADGYNVNYFTDETDEGNTADYSNYLRS